MNAVPLFYIAPHICMHHMFRLACIITLMNNYDNNYFKFVISYKAISLHLSLHGPQALPLSLLHLSPTFQHTKLDEKLERGWE